MKIRSKANTFTARLDKEEHTFLNDTKITEILEIVSPENKEEIVLAKINNRIHSLHETVNENCTIEWVPMHSIEGMRAYQQTLCMLLVRAVSELYPQKKLVIDHSLGHGIYCQFKGRSRATKPIIRKLKKRMQEIIESDEFLLPVRLTRDEIRERFRQNGETSPYVIGDPERLTYLTFYRSGTMLEYPGYPLLPKTGRIRSFDLQYWPPGLVVVQPEKDINAPVEPVREMNLFVVFHEYSEWGKILGIKKAADVNEAIENKKIFPLIKIAEGLQEKKIAQIADMLAQKNNTRRIVLIAGPSSSGKTTFMKRLKIQLRVNGLQPLVISLDDYFLNREATPRNEKGEYDFESPGAINSNRLNHDLEQLLGGKLVQLPKYNFKGGISEEGKIVSLERGQPVLIEGIHCLNDEITFQIPRRRKMKIYVSDLTQINVTDHLRIPTSDVRLLRRMVRDAQFRGHSAIETLQRWPAVRIGEENNIFPFQEDADIIFNSSLIYEIPVLKSLAEPLLGEVSREQPEYTEAQRILLLLSYFLPVSPDVVPLNSILREFTGGSSFTY